MSVADSFIGCLKNVHSSIPSKLMSSLKDGLLIELDKNGGNLTLNDFIEFLKGFSLNLKKQKDKTIIGDLSKRKDQKWWADVLGMDLSDLDKLIVRDYEAIFKPGKKTIFPIGQIQDKVISIKDCLNKELESNKPKPQPSPLSDVSSPDLSYEPEPEPVPMKRKEELRKDPHDGKMYTRQEFIENYGDTEEWDAAKNDLNLLMNKEWTYKSLGLGLGLGGIKKTKKRKKKTKKTKKKKTKKKKTKKKKTKKRIKR
jgi:hypothetical protein